MRRILVIAKSQEDEAFLLEKISKISTGGPYITEQTIEVDRGLDLLSGGMHTYDVILLTLPADSQAVSDTIVRVKGADGDTTPIIAAFDTEDEALCVQAVQAGAQDCLIMREATPFVIGKTMRYAMERHKRQINQHQASFVDELTSLFNRRGFLFLAEQQLKTANRMKRSVTFFFIDLDGMKRINDLHGHKMGDRALCECGEILREAFRGSDIIARLGGDEFAVLAFGASQVDSKIIITRLVEKMEQNRLKQETNSVPFRVELSVGAAVYDPEKSGVMSVDEIIAVADKEMYVHKRMKREDAGAQLPFVFKTAMRSADGAVSGQVDTGKVVDLAAHKR